MILMYLLLLLSAGLSFLLSLSLLIVVVTIDAHVVVDDFDVDFKVDIET